MYNDKILKYINKNNLINANDHILVAVSAGPDSMCLLHYLNELKMNATFSNLSVSVAHVNHHTRGHENDEEETLIGNYCKTLAIDFYKTDFYYSEQDNFHHEAHQFRYAFFTRLAKEVKANKIALAHHLDDQIETILFRLMRGTHLQGYSGIKNNYFMDSDIKIIRPFLEVYKEDILVYCEEFSIPFLTDSSNDKNTYTRNKIRNSIIPQLTEIQTDVKDKIIQFKHQVDEANELIEHTAQKLFHEIYRLEEYQVLLLDLSVLKLQHHAIIRWIVIYAVNLVTSSDLELSYMQINNIIDIIKSQKPNVDFDLGNDFKLVKQYNQLIIRKTLKPIATYQLEINKFGEYILPNQVKLNVKNIEEKVKFHNKNLFLCYNKSMWPLFVRTPEPGDRIETKIGRKKLNRIFINQKIPKHEREHWPILTDKDGRILWVIGLEKSSCLEEMDGTNDVVIEVKNGGLFNASRN
jgi:tRNA(Ile)-lysidine synthetase-like protein